MAPWKRTRRACPARVTISVSRPSWSRRPGAGWAPVARPRKRVLVIGAGMAGLVAAYELMRQGHEPVVLEAQQRVGGRVLTLRDFAPRPVRGSGGRCAYHACTISRSPTANGSGCPCAPSS
ncbi:FAD-dependent oxidoreductase [Nonomuraea ferruginea]